MALWHPDPAESGKIDLGARQMSSKVVGGLAAAAILFLAGSSAAYSADMSVSRSKVYSSSRGLGTRHELGFWGNPLWLSLEHRAGV